MAVTTVQCWEQCFRSLSCDDRTHEVLTDLYKIGNKLKIMKDIYAANGVTFLIDSALGDQCPDSSSSSSSESWEDELKGEDAAAIWTMQLQLMAILAAMVGSPSVYPVQFNENAAWSCAAYNCLTTCQTVQLVTSNFLTQVEVNVTSCEPGLVEAACFLGRNSISAFPCASGIQPINNMLVAILNSKVLHNLDFDNEKFSGPCTNLFTHRYALGLHRANREDMVRFESEKHNHDYISDGAKSRFVVNEIFNCMNTQCCTGSTDAPVVQASAGGCNIAFGETGENIVGGLNNF
jgi:hypothetical protein